jgi:Condensation domain
MLSEIRVGFHGDGDGAAELTWGQLEIWLAMQRTGQAINLSVMSPLASGTSLTELAAMLAFLVSRHPVLRTRLRFPADPPGQQHPRQVVAAAGEVPLHVADIGNGDDPAAAAEELRLRWELAWFDYENEFPVRMGVIRRPGALTHLVTCYSHLMVDGDAFNTLDEDLLRLGRITEEATAPAQGLSQLDVARWQGSPAGQRQSDRAIQYWADSLARLPAWRPSVPACPQQPRFWELAVCSPAMALGMRLVAARTGASAGAVLLAAYAAASARVFGRDPSVAQVIVGNRFRRGFAGVVSQACQPGICVVDAADATFDTVVARARRALAGAVFHAYYDPLERAKLLDENAARRGQPPDIDWFINDRRGMAGLPDDDCRVPTEAGLTQVLAHTTLAWNRKLPMFSGTLYIQADFGPMRDGRLSVAAGRAAVYLEVWADTHHFILAQVEAFAREMEAVVVAAAFDARAVAVHR